MQTPKHSDELANWVSDLLAVSVTNFAMCNSISHKVNFQKDIYDVVVDCMTP